MTSLFFPPLRDTESRRGDAPQAGSKPKSRVTAPRAPSPCQPPPAYDLVDLSFHVLGVMNPCQECCVHSDLI